LNERLSDHLADPHPDLPRERQWQVRAREVVLATGAIERPLVFPGNDRPGIMLAGAARTWLNRYGVVPGTRAVVVTAHDEAYPAALELQAAGVFIASVADVRAREDGPWAARARGAGIPVLRRATVLGTGGRRRVSSILLAQLEGGEPGGQTQPCDLVLMCGGFTPSVHLFSQSRGKLWWDEGLQAFLPGTPAERVRSAGACRGVFALDAALADGAAAGAGAAREATAPARTGVCPSGAAAAAAVPPAAGGGFAGALPQPAAARARAFVDWQNDVTTRDLALATREGFRSIEHVKRYTTTGMATDQGKTSNLNALGVVARVSENCFHVTTTTGGAPRVLAMMEDYLQTEWSDLKVWLTSTTEQWAVIAVQGPNARAVLAGLVDIDLAAATLPHMSVALGRISGVPMRLFRLRFTGGLGFEVNVPADFGSAVWAAIWDAGQAHGMTPYGTETMHVLRAEKGYIIVGQDTDGTVTPDDAGLGWAIGKNKPDFVGKRSLERAAMTSPQRRQLVGLLTTDPQ